MSDMKLSEWHERPALIRCSQGFLHLVTLAGRRQHVVCHMTRPNYRVTRMDSRSERLTRPPKA